MSAIPVWLYGILGGLVLGCFGLLIIWPGCSRGARNLLTRFVVSVLIKLLLAGVGFWIAIKHFHVPVQPLVYGFLIGYIVSLFMEILPCIWKLRRCASDIT